MKKRLLTVVLAVVLGNFVVNVTVISDDVKATIHIESTAKQ